MSKSAWRRANWDKWTLGHKIRHVISVILAVVVSAIMVGVFLAFIIYIFGLEGFIMNIKDRILLDLMHTIFG